MEQFLIEARDFVEEAGANLLQLEREASDPEVLDSLFRRVHTLKGNAALFGFRALSEVCHAAEDVLDEVRDGNVAVSPDLIDCLLEVMDLASRMLESIEKTEGINAPLETTADSLAKRVRDGWLPAKKEGEGAPQRNTVVPPADRNWLNLAPDAVRKVLLALGKPVRAVRYVPEPECFFKGEDPLFLVRNTPRLLWAVASPREPWSPAEQTDVYRCNLVFDLVSQDSEAVLREHFRYVADQIGVYELSLDDPDQTPEGSVLLPSGDSTYEGLAKDILTSQRRVLEQNSSPETAYGRITSVGKTLEALLRTVRDQASLASLANAVSKAQEQAIPAPLIEWLDTQLQSLAAETPSPLAAPEHSDDSENVHQRAAEQSLSLPIQSRKPTEILPRAPHEESISVLKVPMAKVDRLMELIGEMVVAKNALPYLAARAEQEYGSAELAREIKSQYAVIHRIAQEMQDGIQQIRMLPVGSVFQRFPRLVRDLSRSLGKQVELIVEGEETEVDKNIVEALADPMIHILRNSLDHGIELPAERSASGKSPVGRLVIRADQDGDRVRILVEDDGRGIDPAVIKRKAYEKGLIDESKLDSLSDEEAIHLVFLPGFSTAASVSDLSGRGVGMDVVRRSLERVGGTVQLTSRPGTGTSIVLSLPLSMAVSRVMVIRVCGQNFGVPLEHVVETVQVTASETHMIGHRRVAVLRGEVIPLYRATELLRLHPADQEADEFLVLVARLGGETIGLIVDGFAQAIDVIVKPLEGPLAKLPGYAGTALLGDGSVLLILNLKELL
jgi:two-component system chemotaxis sensor kinase CheA